MGRKLCKVGRLWGDWPAPPPHTASVSAGQKGVPRKGRVWPASGPGPTQQHQDRGPGMVPSAGRVGTWEGRSLSLSGSLTPPMALSLGLWHREDTPSPEPPLTISGASVSRASLLRLLDSSALSGHTSHSPSPALRGAPDTLEGERSEVTGGQPPRQGQGAGSRVGARWTPGPGRQSQAQSCHPTSPSLGHILGQPVGTQTWALVLKKVMPSGQKQPSVMGPASGRALWRA